MTAEEREMLRHLIDRAQRVANERGTCERCGEPFAPNIRGGRVRRFCSRRCQKLTANSRREKLLSSIRHARVDAL